MSGDVEYRAVLDSSAMVSYAQGHLHVGEIVIEVAAEDAYVALPTVALLDAYSRTVGNEPAHARLGILVALPGIQVLELGPLDASEVSLAVPLVAGDLARAHAVWAALEYDAYYLTTEPHLAPSILTADQVHHIPADDA